MTTVDFELLQRIGGRRRFDARTLEIAKRLLVHGEDPKHLSMEYGINLARVYAIRRQVLAAAQEAAKLPVDDVAETAVDFALLESIGLHRRFDPRTLEIAKRLLVHGDEPKRLSAEYGINLQRVYAIRRDVLAAAEEVKLKPGWARVELIGPRQLIERIKRQFEEEMAKLGVSS